MQISSFLCKDDTLWNSAYGSSFKLLLLMSYPIFSEKGKHVVRRPVPLSCACPLDDR